MSQQRKRGCGFEKAEYMGEVEGREGRGELCNYIIISKIKKTVLASASISTLAATELMSELLN